MPSQPHRPSPCRTRCPARGLLLLVAVLVLPSLAWAPLPLRAQTTAATQDGAAGGGDESGQPRFFEELDDLPLMAGLQEMEEANVAFDKPAGRIGEVYAEGKVPADKVRAFYAESLPQFGWKKVSDHRYERDGERLEIEVSAAKGVTTLRLSLSPID